MRRKVHLPFVILIVCLVVPASASAQQPPLLDLSAEYSLVYERNLRTTFTGWLASAGVNILPRVGIVGEIGGNYWSEFGGRASMHAFLAGPRVSVRPTSRATLWGQFLAGSTRFTLSFIEGSATETTLQPGAGLDVWLRPTVGLRIGGDYRRVLTDFRTLNEPRLHLGVVVPIGNR